MGLFRRKRRQEQMGDQTVAGAELTPERWRRFEALCRERLAVLGREGLIDDGAIVTDGLTYGLHNLSTQVARRFRDDRGRVRRRAGRVANPPFA